MTPLRLFLSLSVALLTVPSAVVAADSAPATPAESPLPVTQPATKQMLMDKQVEMDKQKMDKQKMNKQMEQPMLAATNIHNLGACSSDGIALSGIDVVSYHMPSGPLIGSQEFSRTHKGMTYRFLSQQHADLFVAAPDKYLPSYFGWCATSLAIGALTCPNPLNYKLENGQLLLFETTGFTNGQDLWNADPLDYRRRADRNRDEFVQNSLSSNADSRATLEQ